MNPKPKPLKKLVVTIRDSSRLIKLTPATRDARQFIEDEGSAYGYCLFEGEELLLFVSEVYDINEVAKYFDSYNND